jgi:drug/metabolite transporter (DMT)-like permease
VNRKDIIAFILISIGWGSSFFWVKVALEELQPFTLVALRLFIGAACLAVTMLFTKERMPRGWSEWWPLLAVGLTNVAIPLVVTSWGQIFIDSGVAAILLSTVPLFTVLLAQFMLNDDKITMSRGAGLVAGFAGVVLILLRDVGSSGSTAWGYASQLIGSALYSFSAVLARRTMRNTSVMVQSFVPIAFADALIWLAVPFVESPINLPQTRSAIVAILFLGLICSYLTYVMYYYLLHSIGPTRMSMVTYTFPLVGVILGVAFLNEAIDLSLVLGAGLVLGSVFVVNRA